jgi:tRNA (cytidine/uridine-2'-O-)-methyltransferase
MVALALFQPDIPQNTGTILRLAACLGVTVHIIGPTGFELSDRSLKRAGMDYLDHATLVRHTGWTAFDTWRREAGARLILMTTKAETTYTGFAFAPGDVILLGRESAGVPETVHDAADQRLLVPMIAGLRSINVAVTAAMTLGEALRQTDGFPAIRQKGD